MKKIYLSLLLIFGLSIQNVSSQTTFIQEESITNQIAQENEKTLFVSSTEKDNDLHAIISGDKKFFEVLNMTLQHHIYPRYDEMRRLVFQIISTFEKTYKYVHKKVLDATSWQDLEILCGPKEHLASYLAKKIDRTSTEMGRVYFYRTIVTPTANLQELLQTQAIVRELSENEELFAEVCKHLTTLKETEGCLLSFWKEDIFENLLKQNKFNIPFAPKLTRAFNKQPILVEVGSTGYLLTNLGMSALLVTGAVVLPITGVSRLIDEKSATTQWLEKFNSKEGFGKGMAFLSMTAFILSKFSIQSDNKYSKSASDIIGAPMSGMNVFYVADSLKGFIATKNALQTKLIYVARYIKALRHLSLLAQKNPTLSAYFPELKNLNKNLKLLSKKSKDIEKLLSLLETSTFKGDSGFFSWYGRTAVAYQLLCSTKDLLLPFVMTGAQLDVYTSSSKLIREFKDKNITFCFPTYLHAEQPTVAIEDFWNPAINIHKAVPNSLEIGTHNLPHNVMVTGPNAGGKSTTMKGLVINIILGQSLGIAPAKSFSFTPFSTIMTYMNIPDDIVAGKSHFRAEASRAKNLLSAAQSSDKNHFTFIILDEVFNGTTFDEAQAATYALLEEIVENPYTTCIAVTHLPHIPAMAERSGKFGVYRVTSSMTPEGTVHYSHKLQNGISKEPSIAFKILKQEGFDDKFLNKASDFLQAHKGK